MSTTHRNCEPGCLCSAVANRASMLADVLGVAGLPAGTIVQVKKPAAAGTAGMVGMIGIVVDDVCYPGIDVCQEPDAGGIVVYFGWPDASLVGRVARERLKLVGFTTFVPKGEGTLADASVVIVEDGRIDRAVS